MTVKFINGLLKPRQGIKGSDDEILASDFKLVECELETLLHADVKDSRLDFYSQLTLRDLGVYIYILHNGSSLNNAFSPLKLQLT